MNTPEQNRILDDIADFLEALLFAYPEGENGKLPFADCTVQDFHPDFIAAVDSFIAGFRAFLELRGVEIPDSPRSFGGNVYFSLSGHGVGFWDDEETKDLQPLLEEYSASLPGAGRFGGKYRFESIDLSKRRGGKLDLSYLAKYLSAARREMFGQAELVCA